MTDIKLYRRLGEAITAAPYQALQYAHDKAAQADHEAADFAGGVIKALSGGRAYLEIYQDALTLTAHAGDWIVKNEHGEVTIVAAHAFVREFEPYEAPAVTSSVVQVVEGSLDSGSTWSDGRVAVPNVGTDITPPRVTVTVNAKYLDGTPVTESHHVPAPAMLEVSPQLLLAILTERAEREPYEIEGSVSLLIRAQDFYTLWEDAGRTVSDQPLPAPETLL